MKSMWEEVQFQERFRAGPRLAATWRKYHLVERVRGPGMILSRGQGCVDDQMLLIRVVSLCPNGDGGGA